MIHGQCAENEEPPPDLFEEWTKVMANTTMVAQLNVCVKSIREFKHLRELRDRLVRWKAAAKEQKDQEQGWVVPDGTGDEPPVLKGRWAPGVGKCKTQKTLFGNFEEDDVTDLHDNDKYGDNNNTGNDMDMESDEPHVGRHGL